MFILLNSRILLIYHAFLEVTEYSDNLHVVAS